MIGGAEAAGTAGAAGAASVAGAGSPWLLSAFQRGVAIENMLGRNLVQNFPVIDRWANGIATSIKSIDLGAKSYQNISTLTLTVRGYIDTLAKGQGQPKALGGVQILSDQIQGRVLELAIPTGATQTQMAALQRLQQYAGTVGVTLKIIVIP